MYLSETSPCMTVETVTASCLCLCDKSCAIFNVETSIMLKGKSTQFFLFHHWVRIGQTKTSFNRQFSPKRPEVGQIFILRSNFDQNKDHMTSKQVRGPSKN